MSDRIMASHTAAHIGTDQVWCAVPVYNNAATVRGVATGCRSHLPNVIVVDDGSTDADLRAVFEDTDITVIRHEHNQGKGRAIMTALRHVGAGRGTHLLIVDGDGQHDPADIQKFLPAIRNNPAGIVIGCRDFTTENVPGGSRFGRRFSNFWLRLETGVATRDSQSGFRAYPVELVLRLRLHGRHYDFEAEVLTRAAWAGLSLVDVDVGVHYPPAEERVSHFRPVLDNFRISCIHARLVGRRLVPLPHRKLVNSG